MALWMWCRNPIHPLAVCFAQDSDDDSEREKESISSGGGGGGDSGDSGGNGGGGDTAANESAVSLGDTAVDAEFDLPDDTAPSILSSNPASTDWGAVASSLSNYASGLLRGEPSDETFTDLGEMGKVNVHTGEFKASTDPMGELSKSFKLASEPDEPTTKPKTGFDTFLEIMTHFPVVKHLAKYAQDVKERGFLPATVSGFFSSMARTVRDGAIATAVGPVGIGLLGLAKQTGITDKIVDAMPNLETKTLTTALLDTPGLIDMAFKYGEPVTATFADTGYEFHLGDDLYDYWNPNSRYYAQPEDYAVYLRGDGSDEGEKEV